jgi:HK97 gp10 family phage protein
MPATSVRVVLDQQAIEQLARDPEAQALLQDIGDAIATRGASLAARRTGAGARSFHAEIVEPGDEVQVGWDQLHYYMYFHEFGAAHTPRQPALRPALDQYRF